MTACVQPRICRPDADRRFRELARARGVDPDDQWVGRYVDYEWRHARHLIDNALCSVGDRQVLEFGCHIGATSVVLAALGATVTAVDVDPSCISVAKLNARRYALEHAITFLHVPDTTALPFPNSTFDVISCNSVLEYVRSGDLPAVQRELHRVLKPDGLIVILGTSNRLWPREVHTKRWLTNYIPVSCDRLLPERYRPQRGVSPWRIRSGFDQYEDLTAKDGGRTYIEAKRRMGTSRAALGIIAAAGSLLGLAGLSVGLLTPSIYLLLKQKRATT